jgi:hypothetical protein
MGSISYSLFFIHKLTVPFTIFSDWPHFLLNMHNSRFLYIPSPSCWYQPHHTNFIHSLVSSILLFLLSWSAWRCAWKHSLWQTPAISFWEGGTCNRVSYCFRPFRLVSYILDLMQFLMYLQLRATTTTHFQGPWDCFFQCDVDLNCLPVTLNIEYHYWQASELSTLCIQLWAGWSKEHIHCKFWLLPI